MPFVVNGFGRPLERYALSSEDCDQGSGSSSVSHDDGQEEEDAVDGRIGYRV